MPYPIKEIAYYLILGGVIFIAAKLMQNVKMIGEILINTGMLAGFIIIVYFYEKDKLNNLRFEKNEQKV